MTTGHGWTERGGDKEFCSPRMGTTFPVPYLEFPTPPCSCVFVALGKEGGKRFRSGKGFRIESVGLEGFSAGFGGKGHLRMHTSIFLQFGGGF